MTKMIPKILFIDHDAETAAFYRDYLKQQFEVETAITSAEGIQRLRDQGPYDVIVADMDVPETNGVDLLAQCQRFAPDTVRIMVTANTEQRTAIEAINHGQVYEFVNKPCLPEQVQQTIQRGVKHHRHVAAERELLEKVLNSMVKVFAELLSTLEIQPLDENQRVRQYAKALGEALLVPQPWELEAAASLLQIGYLTIPPNILQKVRLEISLNMNERIMLDRVPEIGCSLLSQIPRLDGVAGIVRYQRKNFDGTGFPDDAIAGEKIPLGSRILKVANDLAKLEAQGKPKTTALHELRQRAGEYDPAVLQAAAAYITSQSLTANRGRAVPVGDLKVGHVLAESVFTQDGLKVVGAETVVTPLLLEKLQNFAQLDSIQGSVIVR